MAVCRQPGPGHLMKVPWAAVYPRVKPEHWEEASKSKEAVIEITKESERRVQAW